MKNILLKLFPKTIENLLDEERDHSRRLLREKVEIQRKLDTAESKIHFLNRKLQELLTPPELNK